MHFVARGRQGFGLAWIDLVGLAIGTGEGRATYIPLGHTSLDACPNLAGQGLRVLAAAPTQPRSHSAASAWWAFA